MGFRRPPMRRWSYLSYRVTQPTSPAHLDQSHLSIWQWAPQYCAPERTNKLHLVSNLVWYLQVTSGRWGHLEESQDQIEGGVAIFASHHHITSATWCIDPYISTASARCSHLASFSPFFTCIFPTPWLLLPSLWIAITPCSPSAAP